MGEDASLDDFLDVTDDQEAEPDERSEETGREATSPGDAVPDATESDCETDTADGEAAEQATEPATPTYDWTPGGAACEACDEVVERRWRDDPGFVCESCKDW